MSFTNEWIHPYRYKKTWQRQVRVLYGAAQPFHRGRRGALPVRCFDALAVWMDNVVHAVQSIGDLLQHVIGFFVLMVAKIGVASELATISCQSRWIKLIKNKPHFRTVASYLLWWPSALCLSGSMPPWDLSRRAPEHSAESPCSHAAAPSSLPKCGGRCLPRLMVPWHPPYCRSSETGRFRAWIILRSTGTSCQWR